MQARTYDNYINLLKIREKIANLISLINIRLNELERLINQNPDDEKVPKWLDKYNVLMAVIAFLKNDLDLENLEQVVIANRQYNDGMFNSTVKFLNSALQLKQELTLIEDQLTPLDDEVVKLDTEIHSHISTLERKCESNPKSSQVPAWNDKIIVLRALIEFLYHRMSEAELNIILLETKHWNDYWFNSTYKQLQVTLKLKKLIGSVNANHAHDETRKEILPEIEQESMILPVVDEIHQQEEEIIPFLPEPVQPDPVILAPEIPVVENEKTTEVIAPVVEIIPPKKAVKKPAFEKKNLNPWEEFVNESWIAGNGAVFSTQVLDDKKSALTAAEVQERLATDSTLDLTGNGHTGLAMASVLNLPFGVIRSKENNKEFLEKVTSNIENGGLLVITGHGSAGRTHTSGNYSSKNISGHENDSTTIERSTKEIVATVLQGNKLKSGDKITILLSVCYAAAGEKRCLAKRLGKEFAKHRIHTIIIASEEPFLRFGCHAIQTTKRCSKITFNENTGMKPGDMVVFFFKYINEKQFEINQYKPLERLELTAGGLRFSHPHHPQTITDIVKNSGGYYKGLRVYPADCDYNRYLDINKMKHHYLLRLSNTYPDQLVFTYRSKHDNIISLCISPHYQEQISDKKTFFHALDKCIAEEAPNYSGPSPMQLLELEMNGKKPQSQPIFFTNPENPSSQESRPKKKSQRTINIREFMDELSEQENSETKEVKRNSGP